MSDETPGVGQGPLPPREGSTPRSAVRLTQVVGGQYVLTSQNRGVPALAQISGGGLSATNAAITQGGVTRIISLSPSRNQASPLRPSLTNQSIVNALTKSRPNQNVRLQLFPSGDGSPQPTTQTRSPLKRSLPATPEKKDTYAAKLQRVMNHRNVRSKIVKEKYNEHLLESFHLESGGNILDLYQFAKRPKTQQFLQYIKENAIDPKEYAADEPPAPVVQTTLPTPTATAVSSLPGISHQTIPPPPVQTTPHPNTTTHTVPSTEPPLSTPKPSTVTKVKTPVGNQEQIVEKAKQEAYVVQRISDLQKEGLWSEKRLPKIQEMPRSKAHWDFLLEEMVWLAADFAQERKWKKAAAKKCARMVQKYFQDKALAAQRAEKAQEQHIRRIAAFCAKEIKNFWSNVEKLVEYKQNSILEEKRKKALDQHLSFIVDQTEKYSQLLAEGMNKPLQSTENNVVPSATSSRSVSRANSDDEFQPGNQSSTDDEETIAMEEAADNGNQSEEIEALQRESEMDFQDFLKELPKDYLENRDKIRLTDSEESDNDEDDKKKSEATTSKSKRALKESDDDEEHVESPTPESSKVTQPSKKSKIDEDFTANTSSEEDNEDTIQEQEQAEGEQDHKAELDDLAAENEMSVEELRKKYSGAPLPPEEDTNMSSGTNASKSSGEEDEISESDPGSSASDMDVSSADEEDQEPEIGLKSLLDESSGSQHEGEETKTDNNDLINDAAKIAESIQPKGNTLSSTSVVTPVPFLLKLPLREYQHIGLDWLVTMYERKLNGILADEMGLGKTIQTIALLAHLACEKGNWGPHLIIVPTSVMLNWEMECKKWCPGFKILTYYGTQKERKTKRTGWTKPNAFHICITSYKLVIQDHQSFRRKKWKYLILDEAQNIKNFKSQRWQLLLNFQTQQRLLLTGTPLQNNLMELWSLMHFLMPNVFQSHREFKEWFSNPVTGMIEGNSEYNESIIKRLHKVLRPFLLRRLKCEVEKQMPKKYEHVVMCRLSKRQRFLYDDYMSRAKTRETLASGNLLSVINVLMQLRKVCNHPNLFEVRPTISPFHCEGILEHVPSLVYAALEYDVWKHVDLDTFNLNFLQMEFHLSAYQCYRLRQYRTSRKLIEEICESPENTVPECPPAKLMMRVHRPPPDMEIKVSNLQLVQMKGAQNAPQQNATNISDKITVPAGFAQLVQTAMGKHILFTPSSGISTSSISGTTTVMTAGGQRLTLLSKPAIAPASNTAHSIAKAVVKVQLTSVPTTTTTTMSTTSSEVNYDEALMVKTVGSKFIDKLYANQPGPKGLDVRWDNNGTAPNDTNKYDDEDVYQIILDYEKNKRDLIARVNHRRCTAVPLYGQDFRETVTITSLIKETKWNNGHTHCLDTLFKRSPQRTTDCLRELVKNPEQRIEELSEVFNRFIVYVPEVHAPEPELQVWHPPPSLYWGHKRDKAMLMLHLSKPTTPLHPIISAMVTQFPHPRLIQYDCGKLQTLDRLLRKLKSDGHRVLIFTQMTKMLDVLEAFLNFHGHIYLRLDGTTKVDQRQMLMERFNGDVRIFAFILSTRSGGVGVNLTGADTVIFYDSDWNPTMDAQAQDRCHRIGQTRDVHIYRLVSEKTIEENILKKANQKRLLGDLAIEGGNFTTAYFKSSTIQDLFNIDASEDSAANRMSEVVEISKEREKAAEASLQTSEDKAAMGALESALAACEDDQDVLAARTAKAEAVADLAEFDENIPLDDQEKEKEPEVSKAEQEVENLIKQLTPIERYAMRFIEETEAAWSAEQLAAAEREIEKQKLEWEQNRLAAMKEEEERRARELEEDNELLTFSREDATNQVRSKFKKVVRGDAPLRKRGRGGKLKQMNRDRDADGKLLTKSPDSGAGRLRGGRRGVVVNRRITTRHRTKSVGKMSDGSVEDVNENSQMSMESGDANSNPYSLTLNGDTDSSGKLDDGDDSASESDFDSSEDDSQPLVQKAPVSNHVDHNSPRTRSRGTVAINLWTLDVSPILPGVKPVKSSPYLSSLKKEKLNNKNKDSEREQNSDDTLDNDLEDDRQGKENRVKKFFRRTRTKTSESSDVAPDDDKSPGVKRGRKRKNLSLKQNCAGGNNVNNETKEPLITIRLTNCTESDGGDQKEKPTLNNSAGESSEGSEAVCNDVAEGDSFDVDDIKDKVCKVVVTDIISSGEIEKYISNKNECEGATVETNNAQEERVQVDGVTTVLNNAAPETTHKIEVNSTTPNEINSQSENESSETERAVDGPDEKIEAHSIDVSNIIDAKSEPTKQFALKSPPALKKAKRKAFLKNHKNATGNNPSNTLDSWVLKSPSNKTPVKIEADGAPSAAHLNHDQQAPIGKEELPCDGGAMGDTNRTSSCNETDRESSKNASTPE